MAKGEAYIDIRLKATIETEAFGDGDTYTSIEALDAHILKTRGITPGMVFGLCESMGQSDRWQLWLQDEIPAALWEYAETTEED